MAQKKKVDEEPIEAVQPVEVAKAPNSTKHTLCGHVNQQHYGVDGKLEELSCDLKSNHTGDHHAKYKKNVGEPQTDEKGRVVKTVYHLEEADAYWNDAAGKPATSNMEEIGQTNLWQKDLIMRVMKEHPGMESDEAYKLAKADPSWNAVNEPG